jgi:hypothetical protein
MEEDKVDNILSKEEYEDRSSYRHHKHPAGRFIMLRNILNIAFMIIAIAGVVIYLSSSAFIGVVVVGIGMLIKMTEFCIRFIDK